MIIKISDDLEVVKKIREEISQNDGACPYANGSKEDRLCLCKQFRDAFNSKTNCACPSGLFYIDFKK